MLGLGLGWLALDLDPVPESDVPRNLPGRVFRMGIVPGGIGVFLAINRDGVITGLTLPRTGSVGAAVLEIVETHALGWEVMVVFDDDGLVALSEHGTIPNCFHGKSELLVGNLPYAHLGQHTASVQIMP
jgi:hypothetical protein